MSKVQPRSQRQSRKRASKKAKKAQLEEVESRATGEAARILEKAARRRACGRAG